MFVAQARAALSNATITVLGTSAGGAVVNVAYSCPGAASVRISERPNLLQRDWRAYTGAATQQWTWLSPTGSNALCFFFRDSGGSVLRTSIVACVENGLINDIFSATYGYFTYAPASKNYLPYSYYPGGSWCNTTEIGLWALSHILAYDQQRSWSPSWSLARHNVKGCLNRLIDWQQTGNLYDGHAYYQFYNTITGVPVNKNIPSVDNALLVACLLTINGYCIQRPYLDGVDEITNQCARILEPMDYSLWYDYGSHQFGWLPELPSSCRDYSAENRIINFIARALAVEYGTWDFTSNEYVMSMGPSALIRMPRTYDGIFVAAACWDGSLFTYLFPAQFVREMEISYGTNTIDRAVECQIRYMENNGRHTFGISDGHGPPPDYPYRMGCPPRGSNNPDNDPDKGVIIPGSLIMSLVSSYRSDAAEALNYVVTNNPLALSVSRGFRGSVCVTGTAMSTIYSELDDGHAMLALANVANETAWNSFYANPCVVTAHEDAFGELPGDSAPPVVWAIPAGGEYIDSVSVTVFAGDAMGTGVSGIWYTTDGSDPLTSSTREQYTGPVELMLDTTLSITAVDCVGNETEPRECSYEIVPEPVLITLGIAVILVFLRFRSNRNVLFLDAARKAP